MIKYYKLFDMLNRNDMNKTDLLEIISSKTIAKLSKGANINTDIVDKLCEYFDCQPGDIMEYVSEYTDVKTGEKVLIANYENSTTDDLKIYPINQDDLIK